MVDFLHKPVDPVILFTKLQKYFVEDHLLNAETKKLKINFLQSIAPALITREQSTINLTKHRNAHSEEKLLRMFLDQVAEVENNILKKIRSKDFEHVQKMLHEIQGAAAIFNEIKLVAKAKALENLIKIQTPDRFKIDEFMAELKKSQDKIYKILDTLNRPAASVSVTTEEITQKTSTHSTSEASTPQTEPQHLDNHSRAFSILVADDNELVRQSLQQILISVNIKVMTVSSGEEVLKQLLINHYDLILMDIRMPSLNGIDTTKRIRTQTAFEHIVIIGMSADTSMSTVEICLQAGMKEVYSKLSRPEILLKTVHRFMNS
jgi:CheY-like chemotaxis protein